MAYAGGSQRVKKEALLGHYLRCYKKFPRKKYFAPLAELYRSLDYLEEACEILQEGLRWHPSYIIARALLSQVYYQMGKFVQASLEAERVIRIDPKNLLGLKVLAKSYFKLNEIKKAAEPLNLFLKLFPNDEEALALKRSMPKERDSLKEFSSTSSPLRDFRILPLQKVPDKKIDRLRSLLVKIQSRIS